MVVRPSVDRHQQHFGGGTQLTSNGKLSSGLLFDKSRVCQARVTGSFNTKQHQKRGGRLRQTPPFLSPRVPNLQGSSDTRCPSLCPSVPDGALWGCRSRGGLVQDTARDQQQPTAGAQATDGDRKRL